MCLRSGCMHIDLLNSTCTSYTRLQASYMISGVDTPMQCSTIVNIKMSVYTLPSIEREEKVVDEAMQWHSPSTGQWHNGEKIA